MPRVRNRATRSLPTATHTSPSPESMCRGIFPTGNVDIRFSILTSPALRSQRSTRSYGPRTNSPTMKPSHQRVKAGHHTHTRQRTLLAVRPFESAVSVIAACERPSGGGAGPVANAALTALIAPRHLVRDQNFGAHVAPSCRGTNRGKVHLSA
jgi:hypothetical protein